ncbi:hypothetical protein BJX64DRAFT_287247 [Aspergillus heterothallicus]
MRVSQLISIVLALALAASALPRIDDTMHIERDSVRVTTNRRPDGGKGSTAKTTEHESRAIKHDVNCYEGVRVSEKAVKKSIEKIRDMVSALDKPQAFFPYLAPGTCGVPVCEDGTKISWCNDVSSTSPFPSFVHRFSVFVSHELICGILLREKNKNREFALPNFNYIADGVQVILDECGSQLGVRGTLDHNDRWKKFEYMERCLSTYEPCTFGDETISNDSDILGLGYVMYE